MPINLAFDDALLSEAPKAGGLKIKKDTVNAALREFIQRRKQTKIIELFGTIEFDPTYNHKKGRSRPWLFGKGFISWVFFAGTFGAELRGLHSQAELGNEYKRDAIAIECLEQSSRGCIPRQSLGTSM